MTYKSKKKLAADDPRHGTRNAYHYYGCRCVPCTAANSVASTAARRRKDVSPKRSLPWEPLELLAKAPSFRCATWAYQQTSTWSCDNFYDLPAFIAECLGMTVKSVQRARKSGRITMEMGEHAAHSLGLHPTEIWSEYSTQILQDAA